MPKRKVEQEEREVRKRKVEQEAMPARPSPPPWPALSLVAPFLDAASLTTASCVSSSWHAVFGADDLWAPLCRAHYPSALGLLRHLPSSDGANGKRCSSSPHHRLFALFRSASARSRALPPPRLALADITFAVDIFTAGDSSTALSFAVKADEVGDVKNAAGRFQFGVDVSDRNAVIGPGEWRVRWTAVRQDQGAAPAAAVLMMDAKVPAARAASAICFGGKGEAGVAEELRAPGCGGATMDAEVVVELSGEERLMEKVKLGVLCHCRYLSVDDGLRYLQHFLM